MLVNWIIISTIVRAEKCPTSYVAVVFVTGVKQIAVEVECIASNTTQAVLILTMTNKHSFSGLMAIFPGEPGLAGFIEAEDDGNDGDHWSYKPCKAPVKLSPPTNHQTNTQLFTGQMPFLSSNQQCQSTEGKLPIIHNKSITHIVTLQRCSTSFVTYYTPFSVTQVN